MIRITSLLAGLALSLAAFANGPQYALGVNGLACPFCAYGIEKQLKNLEGVNQVTVDIAGSRVLVTVKEGVTLTREKASQAVDEAGFSLRSFRRVEQSEGDAAGDAND